MNQPILNSVAVVWAAPIAEMNQPVVNQKAEMNQPVVNRKAEMNQPVANPAAAHCGANVFKIRQSAAVLRIFKSLQKSPERCGARSHHESGGQLSAFRSRLD